MPTVLAGGHFHRYHELANKHLSQAVHNPMRAPHEQGQLLNFVQLLAKLPIILLAPPCSATGGCGGERCAVLVEAEGIGCG